MLRKSSILLAFLTLSSTAFPKLASLTNAVLDQLEGTWECPGYGKILSISNRQVQEFHISSRGCLVLPDQSQASVKEQISFVERLSNNSFLASPAPIGNRFYWERSDYNVANCSIQSNANALATFDQVVAYMNDHYPFFAERGVDWEHASSTARSKLRANSSETHLFNTIRDLIEQLDDPHTALYAGFNGQLVRTSDLRPKQILPILKNMNPNWSGTDYELFIDWIIQQLSGLEQNFLENNHGVISTTPFFWRKFQNIGYLHVGSMAGFNPYGNVYQELLAFENALDTAFSDLAGADALILDLSFNLGGYEWLSIALAERLARSPITVFEKGVHNDQGTQTLSYELQPSLRPSYHGPIYLLTSDITVSAGEALGDAVRALPQTRHYGLKTAGAMSTVLSKPLPNGWGLTLSNEIYKSQDGLVYEAKGLTPELHFNLWNPENPYEAHIARVEKLVAHIRALDHSVTLDWKGQPEQNTFTLRKAEKGTTIRIQKSTDLLEWSTIKTLTFFEKTTLEFATNVSEQPVFFRAVQL